MSRTNVTLEIDRDLVAWVRLNRADKHNALSVAMMRDLIDVFRQIGANEEIRAVVLTGNGSSFCAGADLAWMRSNLDKSRDERIAESKVLASMLAAIDQCPKLVIGRINGQAFGGGVGLIAVCDIAIGDQSAKYSLTEVKLGLAPANIAPYVIRKIGVASTRRLALNAYLFDGKEAAEIGLLDAAYNADKVDKKIKHEIELALSAAPQAIATTKRLLSELHRGGLDNPTNHVVTTLADIWEGAEAQDGIRAFFNKQRPPWKRKHS